MCVWPYPQGLPPLPQFRRHPHPHAHHCRRLTSCRAPKTRTQRKRSALCMMSSSTGRHRPGNEGCFDAVRLMAAPVAAVGHDLFVLKHFFCFLAQIMNADGEPGRIQGTDTSESSQAAHFVPAGFSWEAFPLESP